MATWLNETSFPSGNGSHFRLRLYYDITQSTSGNYSDITFYEYFASVDGYSGSGASSNGYVNGNWVGSTTSVGRNAEVYLGSRTDRYYHNNDGTGSASYSASIISPWGLGTASLSGVLTLPTIQRQATVTSATNFTDEENPVITYSNPVGYRINAKVEFADQIIVRQNIPNTGSYTFELTPAERALIRQKCTGKSMTVRQTIATCIGGTTETYWSWLDKTMTMVNATPTKSSFDVIDTNTTTTAITGDNTKFIKSASNAKVNFNFSTLKYATLSVMKINGVTIENITPESSSEGTTNYEVEYTINGINTSNIDIYIKDSRGYEYTETKTIDLIDYIPVSANATANRKQPTTGEIETKFNGNYFNSTLGNTSNTLTIKYKYKKVEEQSYSNYITLVENTDYTIDNNTFYSGTYSSEYPITLSPSFDYRYDYEIVIEFSDLLTTASKTITVIKGIPIIQWNKTKFQVNGNMMVADRDGTNGIDIKTYIDNKCKNEVATIQITNAETWVAEGYIPFNTITSTSDKLTLSSNGIKIGSGVSKIKVSANVFGASTSNTGYLWTQIQRIRENQSAALSIAIDNTSTYFASTAHTSIIADVQENDIIKLYKIDNNNTTIRGLTNTYLTVEVVE